MTRERRQPTDIDPDPVTVIVTALGVAGSIASLASIPPAAKWYQDRTQCWAAARDALTALDSAVGELRGYLGSLRVQYLASRREPVRQTRGLAFGRERVYLEAQEQSQWFATIQKLMQAGIRVHRQLAKLLRLYAASKLRMREDVAQQLEQSINGLNELLVDLHGREPEQAFADVEAALDGISKTLRGFRDSLA